MMQLNGLHLLKQTSDKKVVISPQFAELEEKLKDIKNVKVDPISMTITADTSEAMKAVNDAAKGIDGLSVSFEVKPEIKDVKELQKGLSGSSKNTFDWLRSTQQTKMNDAEIGSIEYAKSYASLIDITTVESLLNAAFKNNITISDDTKESLLQQLVDGNNIPASTFDTLIATINEQLKQKNLDPLSIDVNTGEVKQGKVTKEMTNFTDKMSKALGGISSIFGGVERMGIKLDDGIKDAIDTVQGVMQIIQGVQTVIQVVQGTELAANTAALTLLTAALYANTYASLIPGIAGGGIAKAANGFIGGNEHTDAIPVLVQSGELILNKAQQGNLASQLQDANGSNNAMRVVGEIQGEKIVLVANRFLKRTGQGELVTWKD